MTMHIKQIGFGLDSSDTVQDLVYWRVIVSAVIELLV